MTDIKNNMEEANRNPESALPLIEDFVDAIAKDDDGVWVEYPDITGFEVKVAYMGREQLKKLADKLGLNQRKGFRNKPANRPGDDDKFIKAFSDAAIKDWRGLTINKLRQFALVEYRARLQWIRADAVNRHLPRATGSVRFGAATRRLLTQQGFQAAAQSSFHSHALLLSQWARAAAACRLRRTIPRSGVL